MSGDFYSESRGCSFHPGGWELTEHAVRCCGFPEGARLCDMGCGAGEAVDRLKSQFGFSVTGVEPSGAMSGGRGDIARAEAENTGLAPCSFDGVLFECVLSLCDPVSAISEARRILRPGGRLIVSDLYSKSGGEYEGGPVRRVFAEGEAERLAEKAGFRVTLFEDHTRELAGMAMQMIMDGLSEELCGLFSYLREIKCGYFLLIAEKV